MCRLSSGCAHATTGARASSGRGSTVYIFEAFKDSCHVAVTSERPSLPEHIEFPTILPHDSLYAVNLILVLFRLFDRHITQ